MDTAQQSEQVKTYPYVGNGIGVILTSSFMAFYILAACYSIYLVTEELPVIHIIMLGQINFDALSAMLDKRSLLSTFTIIIYITCRSLFVNWAYYTQRNLHYFKTNLHKFDVWRMIFGFILPIFNFYWPIIVIDEIWRGSNPKLTIEEIKNKSINKGIILWWYLNLFWIAFSIIDNFLKVTLKEPSHLWWAYCATAFGDVMGIIVMGINIYLVIQIYRRQQQRYKMINP